MNANRTKKQQNTSIVRIQPNPFSSFHARAHLISSLGTQQLSTRSAEGWAGPSGGHDTQAPRSRLKAVVIPVSCQSILQFNGKVCCQTKADRHSIGKEWTSRRPTGI